MFKISLSFKNMRKFYLIIVLIFLQAPALSLGVDWSSVYDGYDEAEYGEIISEQEYKDALNKIQNLQKKKKSDKKEKKEEKKQGKKVLLNLPAANDALFRLMSDVNYKGKAINRGFYLVTAIKEGNGYFIRLTQGKDKIIADIEANMLKGKGTEKSVSSEILKDRILKITYTERELVLEAYLWIQ